MINAALNYGYSILRAGCARSIVGAGLLPALGLHHSNQGNPFCLADDLMEVFRPLVDITVYQLDIGSELCVADKQALVAVLQADVEVDGQKTTVINAILKLAFSLVNSYQNKKIELILPRLGA